MFKASSRSDGPPARLVPYSNVAPTDRSAVESAAMLQTASSLCCFKQKTAYEITRLLEFRRVLFRSDQEGADAIETLTRHGWRVINAMTLSRDIALYRDYILASRGEFTVAKDQNVRLRSGWFSDRSACYLATGRPVVTQDTAFGKFVPT